MNVQNRQRQEILQKINTCNSAINGHKKEIAQLDFKIDSLLTELQELERGENISAADIPQ